MRLNVHDKGVTSLLLRLNFRFTPTFILFDGNGEETWRTTGAVNPEEAKLKVASLP